MPVIHRDIKPSNILLHSRSGHSVGQVYLVDFGSVQNQAAKFGGTITVVGTYGYMAPEQFGGRSVPASDLYGLGATLIYLVTGLHPTEMSQQDLKIQFADRASQLNPDLIDWLEWMTEPSLDKRLSSAEEALLSLKNPRQISKNIRALQPQGSEIKLAKNAESIEIVIPPKGVGFGLVFLFATEVAATLRLWSTYDSLPDRKFWVTILGFLIVGVIMYLFAMFRELHLRIDRQQISYSGDLFGLKWNYCRSSPRQDICRLEIEKIAGYQASQIIVTSGKSKYKLGKKQGLSASEIEWLASELSQWLKLKIIIVKT